MKFRLIEKMIILLFSNDALPENLRDGILNYITKEGNEELRKEALYRYFSSAEYLGNATAQNINAILAEQLWPEIARELDLNTDLNHYRATMAANARKVRPMRRSAKSVLRRNVFRVAAVLLPIVLIVGGYLLWDSITTDVAGDSAIEAAVPFIASNTVSSEDDDVKLVILPDSTMVILNRNSTISYNNRREAELTGEAFFRVTKNAEHPFVINSSHFEVTVLGTEFNFRTRATDGNSALSLYSGTVRLRYKNGTYTINTAGQEFVLDHATAVVNIREFDNNAQPDWMNSLDLYAYYSLGDIFSSIEQKYGVRFENMDAVDTVQRLLFRMNKGISLDTLMSVLQEASGDFDYTINEDTIMLQPKKEGAENDF